MADLYARETYAGVLCDDPAERTGEPVLEPDRRSPLGNEPPDFPRDRR